MSAIMIERNTVQELLNQVKGYRDSELTEVQQREVALARLLDVLEAGAPEYLQEHAENALECGAQLSQLARLRAAHASYALSSGNKMRRVGHGAWLHERYV